MKAPLQAKVSLFKETHLWFKPQLQYLENLAIWVSLQNLLYGDREWRPPLTKLLSHTRFGYQDRKVPGGKKDSQNEIWKVPTVA